MLIKLLVKFAVHILNRLMGHNIIIVKIFFILAIFQQKVHLNINNSEDIFFL